MIAQLVYMLCGAMSLLCAAALYRQFTRTQLRLLFWSSLCFLGFALNNILLFVDFVVVPGSDLSVIRLVPGLMGVGVLIFGFIWDIV